MDQDVYRSPEMNLNNEFLSHSNGSQIDVARLQAAQASSTAGSASASATAGSVSGAIAGVIPAVASVAIMAVVVTTMMFTMPQVNIFDMTVTYDMIAFMIEVEESENPYIIKLANADEEYILEMENPNERVHFHHLRAETNYRLTVENDYGGGLEVVKEYSITTAGLPILPEGTVKIIDHSINFHHLILILMLEKDDPEDYLYDFYIMIINDGNRFEYWMGEFEEQFVIELYDLSSGFIRVEVHASTHHPYSEDEEILLTNIEIELEEIAH